MGQQACPGGAIATIDVPPTEAEVGSAVAGGGAAGGVVAHPNIAASAATSAYRLEGRNNMAGMMPREPARQAG